MREKKWRIVLELTDKPHKTDDFLTKNQVLQQFRWNLEAGITVKFISTEEVVK